MKKAAVVMLLFCATITWAQTSTSFPAPKTLGDVTTYGRNIQRTMTMLATSTPQHRNTVRILFYGQSITEQTWTKMVSDDLRRRFPHATLIAENRAIGGHSSQLLVKTMEADVFAFKPDLIIFHVYGAHDDYERIIRAFRERTTAEILLQTDHLRRDDDPNQEIPDPSKIVRSKETWNEWWNYVFLPEIAGKYGAELISQREVWKAYLRDHNLSAGALLSDQVHLNEHGNFLMAEIVKAYLRYDPKLKSDADVGTITTYQIGKDVKWKSGKMTLPFDGNRVDLIVKKGSTKAATITIDGKKPLSFAELYNFNRASAYPDSNWPMLLRVQHGAPLLLEDWTLTLTELSDDFTRVKFTLRGSQTGDDGTGISTEQFVSNSGRIIIEPSDWNLEYCLKVFNRPISSGHKIEWKVVPQFVNEIVAPSIVDPTIETTITVANGLTNGNHTLEITGDKQTPIAAIRVYRPASKKQGN